MGALVFSPLAARYKNLNQNNPKRSSCVVECLNVAIADRRSQPEGASLLLLHLKVNLAALHAAVLLLVLLSALSSDGL